MASERVRIYDIARKLRLPNKDVMTALSKNLGVKVKSHSSTITQEEADKVTAILKKTDAAPAKKPQKPEIKPEVKAEQKPVQQTKPEPAKAEPAKPEEKPQPQPEQKRPPKKELWTYRPESKFSSRSFQKEKFELRRAEKPPEPEKKEPEKQETRPVDRPTGRPPRPDIRPDGRPSDRPPRPDGRPGERQFQQGRPDRRPTDRPPRPDIRPDGRPTDRPPRSDGRPGERQFQQRRPDSRPTDRPPRPNGRPGERQFQQRRPDSRPTDRPPRPNGRPGERQFQQGRPTDRPPRPDGRPGQFNKPGPAAAPPPQAVEEKSVRRDEHPKKREDFKSKKEIELEKLEELKLKSKLLEKKKAREEEEKKEQEKVKEVSIEAALTVGELAEKLGESVAAVIKQLMMSGIMATVNQTIDVETAKKAAEALEYTIVEPEKIETKEQKRISTKHGEDEANLVERAPVVTIMGHVDHGKTTLLDSIRKTKHKIVSTEAGGITQSIGAYTAEINDKKIIFVDTPGHSAFTAMRARGAKVTDIVIVVIAADDGIMPQTIEAINHAKAAKVPIIIAVNKIDKENADPDRALQQLTDHELVPEKWGGDTIAVELSALQGTNLDELLEYILLVAEIEELKANPNRNARGVVIESKLDKGKGAVATLLVQTGTLKVGDHMISGTVGGKIRALIDDHGQRVQEVGPSTPVEILGLSEIPEAGEIFEVVDSDKAMKDIANKRKEEARTSRLEALAPANAKREALLQGIEGEIKELNIIIKATTHGSAEAVSGALQQLESKKIFVKIIHLAIGDISEADVMLASASNAIIIGFGVKEDPNALKVAADEGIVIRKYDIIYKMLEDIEQTMLGLLEPEYKEVEVGTAEVRQIFTVGKNIKIAGCYVLEGKIIRNKEARVIRDGKEIYKGTLNQLKRFKDDVKEVNSGYECGISFDKFNDLEEGDLIKVLTKEEIQRHTLV